MTDLLDNCVSIAGSLENHRTRDFDILAREPILLVALDEYIRAATNPGVPHRPFTPRARVEMALSAAQKLAAVISETARRYDVSVPLATLHAEQIAINNRVSRDADA